MCREVGFWARRQILAGKNCTSQTIILNLAVKMLRYAWEWSHLRVLKCVSRTLRRSRPLCFETGSWWALLGVSWSRIGGAGVRDEGQQHHLVVRQEIICLHFFFLLEYSWDCVVYTRFKKKEKKKNKTSHSTSKKFRNVKILKSWAPAGLFNELDVFITILVC